MSVIKKLSPELIGRIAAGEVVERPASAVKELVENSIDAGASNVTVELRDGGIGYLRVSDNGRGIPEGQVRMAFERHATSKLATDNDLFDIRTLGFRGEALASIAAVGKVTMTTRTREAAFGTRARVEGGEFMDLRQAASPVGTSIVVEELFYNTPVRLKFLKKPAAEAAFVSDYMLRLILSRPDVAFRFVSQGKTVYHSVGDGKIESALFSLYGGDALKKMYRVSGHMNGAILDGYVGVGELSRGNRAQQSLFVNGRYFRSAALSKALENGCEGRVMIGRYPMCALYLQLPYQQVDVNVHPNKLEVRFQNEAAVAQAVETLVSEALNRESLGGKLMGEREEGELPASPPTVVVTKLGDEDEPSAPADPPPQAEQPALSDLRPVTIPAKATSARAALHEATLPVRSAEELLARYAKNDGLKPLEPHSSAPIAPSMVNESEPAKPPSPPENVEQTTLPVTDEPAAPLRLLGVAFNTYWIFESGDRLLLVDQHAAHERILFDEYMRRYEGERMSQQLLSPRLVRLTAAEMALAAELGPVLAQAGFEAEPFDESNVAIRAVPTLFGQNDDPRELFLEALDEWQNGRDEVTRERMRRRVAQMACKRAIKGGDALTEADMRGFLMQMLQSDATPTCPHGRPIVSEVTRYALEKRFKRVQ